MDAVGYALARRLGLASPVVIAGGVRDFSGTTATVTRSPLAIVGDTLYRADDSVSPSYGWKALDLKTGAATSKASVPSALVEDLNNGFRNANVIGTNIYVTSGTTTAFQMYDTVADTWTAKAAHPDAIGAYLVYVASDGQFIYSGGGGMVPKKYTPGTNTWAAAGAATVGANVSGMSYLTEGTTGRVWAANGSAGTWSVWDPASATTTTKAAPGASRYKPKLFIAGDDIYSVGYDNNGTTFYGEIYIYSKTSNTWTFSGKTMPDNGRSHMAAATKPDNSASYLLAGGTLNLQCTQAAQPATGPLLAYLASK